jgi:anthranilate synthase
MLSKRFTTKGSIAVESTQEHCPLESALQPVYDAIDSKKGGIFSSGFDFPGRHSRWDIGFINPALEFSASKKSFALRGLNTQGKALLGLFAPQIKAHEHIKELNEQPGCISGTIKPPPEYFPEEQRSKQPSVFSVLRVLCDVMGSTEPEGSNFGLYGAFGYDLVCEFEDLKLHHERPAEQPDCILYLPLELIVVDRKKEVAIKQSYSVLTPEGWTGSMPGGGNSYVSEAGQGSREIECDHAPGEFAQKVSRVIEGTKRGDYFEVVLSQTFSRRLEDKPTTLFKRLAQINPSPYMFLLNFGTEQIVGASPEIYVRVTSGRYETCPIAGTIQRGETALEDADRVRQILGSRKDESELTMCTDVDRNDMARVCVPGSVRILGRRQLEFYSHLIHTVDHVEGTLQEGYDAFDAFQTHMWACTVTGAPKPAAMQAIEDLEQSPRGWYSGAIGFLSFSGNLNTGITLRTALLKGGRAQIRAGATLLYGSDPRAEEQETRTKAAAFLAALSRPGADSAEDETKAAPAIPKLQGEAKKVLLVDCKDSFVHNLAAYLRVLGIEVITLRVGFPEHLLDTLSPDLVLLSPGPGTPDEFGIPALVKTLIAKKIPGFGVCLGHQGIGQYFGATLGQLPVPEHGKPSQITHNGSPMFAGITREFEAGRYHSLYLVHSTVPDCLEVTAQTMSNDPEQGNEIIPMAFRHKSLPLAGVQFHPESLMTLKKNTGYLILKNAIELLTK